jgi:hypothetical protein
MTFPDDASLRNWKKVTRRNTIHIHDRQYADRYFEGNKIIIPAHHFNHHPLHHFQTYIPSRDTLHPIASPLWLKEAGTVPTRSFFITRLRLFFPPLRLFFPPDVAGQSMRAGGATALTEHGVSPAIIQASGRWASEAFLVYIRKNPTLLQGFLYAASH